MSSTRVDDVSSDVNLHDNSFDSLPPGETYHSPPFEEDPFDTSAIVIPEISQPRTSEVINSRPKQNGDVAMPASNNLHSDIYAQIKKSGAHQGHSQQPSMLSQLLSCKEGSMVRGNTSSPQLLNEISSNDNSSSSHNNQSRNDDLSFDISSSGFGHRRAYSSTSEAEHALPQLTSPLSPPAFNPADVILGSNEAIAGLDSPALR